MPEELNNLRSKSIQEIIANKPPFVERWALLLFLLILLIAFSGAWLIKYPDVIQANATLFATDTSSGYYLQLNLHQNDLGTIATGQKIQLRFEAYPYAEFGYVPAKLSSISKAPFDDSAYFAKIELPQGLMTNYGKSIQYRNGLKGQAIIVTKEARLLQGFYHSIRSGLQR